MADSKRGQGRLSSFRESVKKITQRLSDGDLDAVKKNDEHAREIDKLQIQIQSMPILRGLCTAAKMSRPDL